MVTSNRSRSIDGPGVGGGASDVVRQATSALAVTASMTRSSVRRTAAFAVRASATLAELLAEAGDARTEKCQRCLSYGVGTRRLSSSNQFTTTIILETTVPSYGCTMMKALPSGVTSYTGLSTKAGA